MQRVIYIDILICLNLFINYLVLILTSKFMHSNKRNYRIVLAAIAGAFYSLIIFLPHLNRFILFFISIFYSTIMIFIAFGFVSAFIFFKTVAYFFLINFSFAGIMFLIYRLITPDTMFVKNGIVYFNFSPLFFIFMCCISYILIRLMQLINIKLHPSNDIFRTQIHIGKSYCNLNAKMDTGNSLVEPFSMLPVIVVNEKSLSQLIPNYEQSSIENTIKFKYRMIPFNSVGKAGVLKSFKPDYITIYNGNKIIKKDAYVAICEDQYLNHEFDALLNPVLLQ